MVALDLGEVRTGVAVSDPDRVIATPLEVVPSGELSGYLRGLVGGGDVGEVVVGVPRTMRGEVGFQAEKVFARLRGLRDEFPGVRFVEWDERLTTRIAAEGRVPRGVPGVPRGPRAPRGAKKGKKRRSGPVDHLAAARMLQEYLGKRGELGAVRQEG